jgi:hypothetical protein
MPYAKALSYVIGKNLQVPVWWYTSGLVLEFKRLGNSIKTIDYFTGFSVWLTNIFVPMYGQRDWKGRLISFLVRLFQVILRGILLGLIASARVLLTLVYISLPIVLIIGLIYSLNGY